ncbi:hypothetical protein QYE76_023567 [Lolium multiflorum]|uniref:CCHC-type domain-containing protein n=1 Tax=Lolium multiflorum TaxID=4521 RepID=A0AAD8VUV3_LOLMU|nr:hypothetical protein QYE76_023567 [Lolium multiflorum]
MMKMRRQVEVIKMKRHQMSPLMMIFVGPSLMHTETENEKRKLKGMLDDHKKKLYPNCEDGNTKLGATLELLQWKAEAGICDKPFEKLLKIMKRRFPKDNELPDSTYEAKKVLCPLGLEVLKIHACINDCILYRHEYENLEKCPVCNALRYKIRRDDPGDVEGEPPRKRVPAKRKFIMMPVLIQGPKQPGNNIDVYLRPLFEELLQLWSKPGVLAWDEYKQEAFNLRALLFVTINDWPALSNLSGQTNKGYNACTHCLDETEGAYLKKCKKVVYLGHRRFLPKRHPVRKKGNHFGGEADHREKPELRTGDALLDMVKDIKIMASPSINFNQFLEKEKLKSNGSNFTDWFRHVRIFLNGGNLQYVLEAPLGPPPPPAVSEEEKNVFKNRAKVYSQVQCAILCSLEAELQKRFEHHNPCEMIRELKVIFETHAAVESYEASKQFFGCMMEEGSSVSEHVFAMSGHARKLSDLGIVIPNQLGIHRVLQSLPPSYKNFVMNYNMQNMNKELPELFSMLKSAEIEIQKEHQVLMLNKTTNFKKQGKPKKDNLKKGGKKAAAPPEKPKGGPKPDTDCYYCNGKGHWKRNCPKYLADLKSGLVKKKKGISIYML